MLNDIKPGLIYTARTWMGRGKGRSFLMVLAGVTIYNCFRYSKAGTNLAMIQNGALIMICR